MVLYKTNRIHILCAQCIFQSLYWAFTRNQNIFFLLSIFADEIMSSMKIITMLPNSVPGNEKLSCLLISAFIVRLTALNKQFSSVG